MYITKNGCKRAIRNIKSKVENEEKRQELINAVIWEYEHQQPYNEKWANKHKKIKNWN